MAIRTNDKIICKYFNMAEYFKKNMAKKASLEFRLGRTDETRHYILGELNNNDLMTEKYNNTCKHLNYVDIFLIFNSYL